MTLSLPCMPIDGAHWQICNKFDARGARLADRHHPRRTHGSPQFLPPGETLVLALPDGLAAFGWHRPHPKSGVLRLDKLDGWCCSIFRNESSVLSSALILDAEAVLAARGVSCGPDGLFTYVEPRRIRSQNPGYCFQQAGWKKTDRWSVDGKKRLLTKPWSLAGQAPFNEAKRQEARTA
jgi:hypothetical protein